MPKKHCSSVRFFGDGISRIALILVSPGRIPSGVHVSPKKDASFTLNWNLSGLNLTLFSLAVSRTVIMC